MAVNFGIIQRSPLGYMADTPIPGKLLRVGPDGKLPASVTARADLTELGLNGTSYDQYQLYLQLYYQGNISDIDVAGLQALTFDGFLDSARISNAGGLDVLTDASHRLVQYHDSGNLTISYLSGTNYQALDAGQNRYQTFTLPRDATIKALAVQLYTNNAGGVNVNLPFTLKSPTGAVLATGYFAGAITYGNGNVLRVTLANPPQCAAGAGYQLHLGSDATGAAWEYYTTNPYAGGQADTSAGYDYGFEVTYQGYDTGNKELLTTNKVLAVTAAEARLYLSTWCPGGSTVTPWLSIDGGTSWVAMIEDAAKARTDPKFSGYTEHYFTLDPAGGFSQLRLKLAASNPAAYSTPQIKRYGLIAA